MSLRANIHETVVDLLQTRKFAELDALENSYLHEGTRTPSGKFALTIADAAIADAFCVCERSDNYWKSAEQLVSDWVETQPNAANSHIAFAHMLMQHAWSYRGTGFVSTVASADWKPFFEYVEKSRLYLVQYKDIIGSDPRWYEMMVNIANLQQWPDEAVTSLLDEALSEHPRYPPIYQEAALYRLPKWGGTPKGVEELVKKMLRWAPKVEAPSLYARIYWYLATNQFRDSIFESSNADWVQMKQGILDILTDYPDPWNLNHFAKFACLAHDRELALELLHEAEGNMVADAWNDRTSFEYCKTWAEGNVP